MSGFVSFVSSGPGDPELLTLKAVNRLQSADAVLFDDLSAGPILEHARAGADLQDQRSFEPLGGFGDAGLFVDELEDAKLVEIDLVDEA